MNIIDQPTYNFLVPLVSTNRPMIPWLQDTNSAQGDVWKRWNVVYRDVRILDTQNRLRGVYNLTANDLGNAQNRQTLKSMILEVARAEDTDGDRLLDAWESGHFGNLDAQPQADTDGDGASNFEEMLFASNPRSAESRPQLTSQIVLENKKDHLAAVFRRLAGQIANYQIEVSPDLSSWSAMYTDYMVTDAWRNLCDGTGAAQTTVLILPPVKEAPRRFLRVRATPKL